MDSEQLEAVQRMIEEAIVPLRNTLEALETRVNEAWDQIEELEKQIDTLDDNTPHRDHYHENYASADHVERSESSFNSRLSRLQDSINDVEYKVHDAERKADRAQSAAESAQRSARGGW